MDLPTSGTIKTREQAEELAIEWQHWQADQDLSYGELAEWAYLFEILGRKFNLTDEFRENGII